MSTPENTSNESPDKLSTDEQWVKRTLQQHLDEEVENLDFNVTSKLSAARHRALAQQPNPAIGRSVWGRWNNLSTSALATTAVVALALLLGSQLLFNNSTDPVARSVADNGAGPGADPGATQAQLSQNVLMEDLQILSASEDLEFFQSIEMLEWMDQVSG